MTWKELLDYQPKDSSNILGFYDDEPDYDFLPVTANYVEPYIVKGKHYDGGPHLFGRLPEYKERTTWAELKEFIKNKVKDLNEDAIILCGQSAIVITEIKDDVFLWKHYDYSKGIEE